MKLAILTLGIAVLSGLTIIGCSSSQNSVSATTKPAPPATTVAPKPATPVQPASPTTTATPDDAPRISLADAKKAFDDKSAIFVDTHSKQTYDAEHVVGAINLTANEVGSAGDKLPKGKKIIAYCS